MKTKKPSARETQNLAVRYGEIGISAVAAAMRYRGEGKAPDAPALSPTRGEEGRAGREPDCWLKEMLPEVAA